MNEAVAVGVAGRHVNDPDFLAVEMHRERVVEILLSESERCDRKENCREENWGIHG